MKFTFKKGVNPTGLHAIGNPYPETIIKHKGREVGSIVPPNWQSKDDRWRIRIAVKSNNGFKWFTVKKTFSTEPDAREYLVQFGVKYAPWLLENLCHLDLE